MHRIGRTARAGSDGIAISLVDADEVAYLRDIEKLIRQALPREDQRTGDARTHAERTGDTRNHQAPFKRRPTSAAAADGRTAEAPRIAMAGSANLRHASPQRSPSGHLNGARTPDHAAGSKGKRPANGDRHAPRQSAARRG